MKRPDIESYWYRKKLTWQLLPLVPFSWLFRLLSALRRIMYRVGLLQSIKLNVPVIVVGNITTGGTRKTPFVIWLSQFLIARGYRPGIVTRGVGGVQQTDPYHVTKESSVYIVGDEACLHARHAGCPIMISIDRVAAAKELIEEHNCDIIISDDGLQHYRLSRDIEIAIVDSERKYGNQYLLPAGPLRESIARIRTVDIEVTNGDSDGMMLTPEMIHPVAKNIATIPLNNIPFNSVHAVAAIGNPDRFFNQLKNLGFSIVPHVFPDHHIFQFTDLDFSDDLPIMMTEKDAVKCETFKKLNAWYLCVNAQISDKITNTLITKLKSVEMRYAIHQDYLSRHHDVSGIELGRASESE